ncbi:hypothetical protein TOT_030000121 [Theileria orientalis strain Shintoku]|uniref:Uncharacterized protein n=1 Tax=Theileria orientalis strain Shintoku TaxID=869250 RepID=J4DPK4_THEOR|nr:hypothetical protein TOT_030000121 [Theileria orientalis strain Shintoku]PVC53470.1 hypothetical protein MACL_00000056 [Theileria orientalis]BAM40859.1 hypothetical protein TOT_030000121 [Theileria orientalis strain Shintoku]|eukprot:XP_009691160.1 hypothetical protein TOT_030000121 [Theileria orientalis strain Shintoku]
MNSDSFIKNTLASPQVKVLIPNLVQLDEQKYYLMFSIATLAKIIAHHN